VELTAKKGPETETETDEWVATQEDAELDPFVHDYSEDKNESSTVTKQVEPTYQVLQDHRFEIGSPDQSELWRYVAFVVLSAGLVGALTAGSSIV